MPSCTYQAQSPWKECSACPRLATGWSFGKGSDTQRGLYHGCPSTSQHWILFASATPFVKSPFAFQWASFDCFQHLPLPSAWRSRRVLFRPRPFFSPFGSNRFRVLSSHFGSRWWATRCVWVHLSMTFACWSSVVDQASNCQGSFKVWRRDPRPDHRSHESWCFVR